MLDLPSIRRRLAGRAAQPPVHPAPKANSRGRTGQAAVAVVLRAAGDDTEMLFIQRAERPGDPWSGHMAFPGGHRDAEDANLCAAAVRETQEEVGLDISAAAMLGALPHQRPMSASRALTVAPFVFEVSGDPAFTLNHEVAAAIWAPLAPMHRGENAARSRLSFHGGGGTAAFNGFRLASGHFVWGLTYRMVQTFLERIDPAYRRLPD